MCVGQTIIRAVQPRYSVLQQEGCRHAGSTLFNSHFPLSSCPYFIAKALVTLLLVVVSRGCPFCIDPCAAHANSWVVIGVMIMEASHACSLQGASATGRAQALVPASHPAQRSSLATTGSANLIAHWDHYVQRSLPLEAYAASGLPWPPHVTVLPGLDIVDAPTDCCWPRGRCALPDTVTVKKQHARG